MTLTKDEHVIEAIGRCRIVIRNGQVVEVGDALIRDCPLAKRFAYPIPDIEKESVKANIEHGSGHTACVIPGREVTDTREFVGFGASEVLSSGSRKGCLMRSCLPATGQERLW